MLITHRLAQIHIGKQLKSTVYTVLELALLERVTNLRFGSLLPLYLCFGKCTQTWLCTVTIQLAENPKFKEYLQCSFKTRVKKEVFLGIWGNIVTLCFLLSHIDAGVSATVTLPLPSSFGPGRATNHMVPVRWPWSKPGRQNAVKDEVK